MTLSYGPGPALLVAVPGLALLTPDDDLARRAWVVLDAGGGPEELVVELIRNGLATLGPFVLVSAGLLREPPLHQQSGSDILAARRCGRDGCRLR
jgi:hypothetical protein